MALGVGRKLRVTLTHCVARLIARHCRRFITATLGLLDRTSRRGSARQRASRGAGGGRSRLCMEPIGGQGQCQRGLPPLHPLVQPHQSP